MIRKSLGIWVAAVLATASFAACGDDDASSDSASSDSAAASSDSAAASSGSFELVKKAPEDLPDLSGEAKLTTSGSGTEASIELSGLKPNTEYASHVHAGSCDQTDPGGDHFQFKPGGSDMPPNEIHLPLISDTDGNASAKAANDEAVPEGEAKAIVLHTTGPPRDGSDKLACAPLG